MRRWPYTILTVTLLLVSLPAIAGAVTLDSLTFGPGSVTSLPRIVTVTGGYRPTFYVRLTGPAPSPGVVVYLASSNPAVAAVPATVTVKAGSAVWGFPVTIKPVAAPTAVTISASYAGVTRQANLKVAAPVVSGVTFDHLKILGGFYIIGTVWLTGVAPVGGVDVSLFSSNWAVAQLTKSGVTVPTGEIEASFTVKTIPVKAAAAVTISAKHGGEAKATLWVMPPVPLGIFGYPESVVGGTPVKGTVRLTGPAFSGGVVVSLASSNAAAATVPATVTVPSFKETADFVVTTKPVAATTDVTISISIPGKMFYRGDASAPKPATLKVLPPAVSALTLNTSVAKGGTQVTGTVTLSGPAPSAGLIVSGFSSHPVVAAVPGSVTVPAGAKSASFTVTTYPVAQIWLVTISASHGGVPKKIDLTVTP